MLTKNKWANTESKKLVKQTCIEKSESIKNDIWETGMTSVDYFRKDSTNFRSW